MTGPAGAFDTDKTEAELRADAVAQDLNFQTALARAIASGKERHPDPERPRPPHFVRPVYPPADRHSGCGSPAAICADEHSPVRLKASGRTVLRVDLGRPRCDF